jgi:hypothetical protein
MMINYDLRGRHDPKCYDFSIRRGVVHHHNFLHLCPKIVRVLMASEGSLADTSLRSIHTFLSDNGSSLSGQGLEAITALLDALETGLNGGLDRAYYLSAIDPGIGKTLAVSLFLEAWKDQRYQPGSSVLIGVSRLSEIETYVRTSGLAAGDFGVLTSDKAFNALGVPQGELGSAPILFTTQQMIESRSRNRSFSAASDFHFNDEPRTLRIWDESFIPSEPLSLRLDDLGQIATPMRYRFPEFVEAVEELQMVLRNAKAGEVVKVPESLEALVPKGRFVGPAKIVKTLERMAGRELLLVDGGNGGKALVGSSRSLPDDFAPVIILDASGRVRTTYRLWEQHRASLRRLPAAQNDYSKLTIHLWQRASGKQALEDPLKRSRIVDGIAKVINEDAKGEWLIVHYKGNQAIFEEVRALVENRPDERLRSLTWGQHHGTNDFAHISNVVIVGQQHYGEMGFQALGAAASGLPIDQLAALDVGKIAGGEFQHHLLQALCRSSVRKSRHGRSGRCRAYVVTTGYPETAVRIAETFPGCRLWPWRDVEEPMTGRRGEAAEYLRRAFEDPKVETVRKVDVGRELGIKSSNLSALIKHKDFEDFLGREWIFSDGQRFVKHRVSFEPYPGGGWTAESDK